MRLTIDSKVLEKHDLSLGEMLVLLIGYYGTDYEYYWDKLVQRGLAEPNLFKQCSIVLSDNSKNLVSEIITESDDKLAGCNIDFEALAEKMMSYYPDGVKAGTTYSWRGNPREIAQKLRVLVTRYDFQYTEEEAIAAVKEYVNSFIQPYKYMQLLKYFILKTIRDNGGNIEINSDFMSIIENNRLKDEDSN